jgi:transposase
VNEMEVVYSRCCGLDIHKKTVVACLIAPEGNEVRTFSTVTRDLIEMAEWLLSKSYTCVAMESIA